MSPDTDPITYLERLMEAERRATNIQFAAIAQQIRDGREQSASEHAAVKLEVGNLRSDAQHVVTEIGILKTEVATLKSSRDASVALRAGDMAKVGILATIISIALPLVVH